MRRALYVKTFYFRMLYGKRGDRSVCALLFRGKLRRDSQDFVTRFLRQTVQSTITQIKAFASLPFAMAIWCGSNCM
jgi:hypothetical protein